jgi:nucleoside-diphosphate-sugar epimerase
MRALVIGGTGPTGPHLVNGLIERGYEVSILHRGTHDSDLIPPTVERIIGDPHFRETLRDALGERTFDLVVATYGRIRYIAEEVVGRTGRFVAIGGPPSYRGMFVADANHPPGMPVPTAEDATRVAGEDEFRFGYLIRLTEDAVFERHAAGHYVATMFRYPLVYGRGALGSCVWQVVERALDGRPHIVLPDGGQPIVTRGYAPNMAHAVLLSVDQPERSGGQIYNCGDLEQFSLAAWVQLICAELGHEMEIFGVPADLAWSTHELMPLQSAPLHQLFDLHKVRHELGYSDVVPARQAIAEVVRWHLAHPGPRRGGRPGDPLNYRAEDEQVAIMRDTRARLAAVDHSTQEVHHPYPHPKEAGLARDHRRR